MLDLIKDLPQLTWDYLKSREGKKCLRRCIMPLIIMGALIMLIVGAIWAKYQYPQCGKDIGSSRFYMRSVSRDYRKISGNSCPGFDWTRQKSTFTAGERNYDIYLPLAPKMAKQPTYVSEGLIGYAFNSVGIYSSGVSEEFDALKVQASKFDHCGGSNSNPVGFTFNLPVTGVYRFFGMPGDGRPTAHASSLNTDFSLCADAGKWYRESNTTQHSPMVGIMADGIPIYGPRGKNNSAPTDLDECNGHASDLPFYHYHFTSRFPYSVQCLRGCLDGSLNPALDSGRCDVNTTLSARNNYTSITNTSVLYGGAGVNSTDWSGPACLLIFGFVIFIPGMLCGICMICANNISKWKDRPLSEQRDEDEEEEDDDDEDDDDLYEYYDDSDDEDETHKKIVEDEVIRKV